MKPIKSIALTFAILVFIFLFTCVYVVNEGQNALLIRLGQLVVTPQKKVFVANPGPHLKWPFIETVKLFDTRLQSFDIQSSRILTAEKKDLLVDYYVKWRIVNLPLYYTTTGGNQTQAQQLLMQSLNDALRAQFGRRTIKDVIADDRSSIMAALLTQADQSAKPMGIAVTDVRIKQIDLPSEVSNAVYERMRAERERVATERRSEGKAQAEIIRANADATVTVTLAQANAKAAALRAQGDAQAATIYANAYSQNPSFFEFYKSMQAYLNVFSQQNSVIVLQTNQNDFMRYFTNPSATGAINTTVPAMTPAAQTQGG